MQAINSLDELKLPQKYKKFLNYFLKNLSRVDSVDRVILFGSCARGDVRVRSDIDLMIIGDNITDEDEDFIYADCGPEYQSDFYSACDIFTSNHDWYNQMKDKTGSLHWRIERDGKDLTAIMRGILV